VGALQNLIQICVCTPMFNIVFVAIMTVRSHLTLDHKAP